MATLTDHVNNYLIAQGIVRDPRVAGALPPCWRMPRDGVRAPGDGKGSEIGPTAVVGLIHSGGIVSKRFEKEWRNDIIEIWLRTTKWPITEALYIQLRAALIDKVNWNMDGITVIESLEWRALAHLDSDNQAFTALCSVMFQTYTADHF